MTGPPPMRADATRNRARILAAARTSIVRSGPDVALESVAAIAGVGIATLYRRFEDRGALLTAVAEAAMEESATAAHEAPLASTGDGLDAIAAYLDRMLDGGAATVIPMLVGREDVDHSHLAEARERSTRAVEDLVAAAHEDGSLAATVSVGDIGTLLVRVSRPLPGSLSTDRDRDLARRHLDIVVAGLRHTRGGSEAGPSFADLRRDAETGAGG